MDTYTTLLHCPGLHSITLHCSHTVDAKLQGEWKIVWVAADMTQLNKIRSREHKITYLGFQRITNTDEYITAKGS
jgi:hypothetical protein